MKKIFEEYRVRIERDAETGGIFREHWKTKDGVHKHPQKGFPAHRTFDPETGKLTCQAFYKDGKLHRDGDKPTIMHFDPCTDMLTFEAYYIKGKRHRDNGPSLISRDAATGKTIVEEWKQHGEFHRMHGKPAYIGRNPTTNFVFREEYHVHGKRHRTDGPAVIWRDENTGEILTQEFYINGKELDALSLNVPDPVDH